ncbi:MAG: cation:proton antiporter [Caulobacteraceae bacterium]
MSAFDLTAIFLTLVGAAGWLNARYLRLPSATVMVLAGAMGAGGLLAMRAVAPDQAGVTQVVRILGGIDFPRTVLGYMLAFLLFAGAMQVDLAELRRRRLSIWTLATLGVLASTFIVGGGLWLTARWLGLGLTAPWAFVFGALISPTDPIAVLATVRHGNLSKTLETVLQAEALFNDGVGIVVFTAALSVATMGVGVHPLAVMENVAVAAVGGGAVGFVLGSAAIGAMRSIDDYAVEVCLTLALATGAYALAQNLHLSGPIAVVIAGLLIGGNAAHTATSDTTRRYIRGFWTLVDEILNALLFLLLGLELLVIPFNIGLIGLWVCAVALVLATRLGVVFPWAVYLARRQGERGASLILAWGGLHGALSLALALSIPPGPARELILSTTFAVVIFSIVVQATTFAPLAGRFSRPA